MMRSLGLLSFIAPPKPKAIKSTKKRKMRDSVTQRFPPRKCAMNKNNLAICPKTLMMTVDDMVVYQPMQRMQKKTVAQVHDLNYQNGYLKPSAQCPEAEDANNDFATFAIQ
jgi:hypothetical protein